MSELEKLLREDRIGYLRKVHSHWEVLARDGHVYGLFQPHPDCPDMGWSVGRKGSAAGPSFFLLLSECPFLPSAMAALRLLASL